jgi:RND family efflux transporter MFP subunit
MRREQVLAAETRADEQALPIVNVEPVRRSSSQSTLVLPGNIQAVTEAPVLARATGYIQKRYVDIGDRVTAGQKLADIEAPELAQQIRQAKAAIDQANQQVQQAEAALVQGRANMNLARVTRDRYATLAGQGVVSRQEKDTYDAQYEAQQANVQALEKAIAAQRSNLAAVKANLARLQQLQAYRLVRAPFRGVITVRNVDVGALVTTGSTLLYRIAQTSTLRTYVNVPQNSVNAVRVGQPAVLTVSHLPGKSFRGTVARKANALDPGSRTMLVEIDVPNADGALFPGTFTEVDLAGVRTDAPVVVPAAALIFRTDGAQLAVVQPDSTVHLQKVTVGRDYGDRVEIQQGVEEGATIVAVAGDSAREGAKITPYDRESQP